MSQVKVLTKQNSNYEHRQAFENRYAIYCADPQTYTWVDLEKVEQLAKELGAINPIYCRKISSHGYLSTEYYLTAEKFNAIQPKIYSAISSYKFDVERFGKWEELDIEIEHQLFYNSFPVLLYPPDKDTTDKRFQWGSINLLRQF